MVSDVFGCRHQILNAIRPITLCLYLYFAFNIVWTWYTQEDTTWYNLYPVICKVCATIRCRNIWDTYIYEHSHEHRWYHVLLRFFNQNHQHHKQQQKHRPHRASLLAEAYTLIHSQNQPTTHSKNMHNVNMKASVSALQCLLCQRVASSQWFALSHEVVVVQCSITHTDAMLGRAADAVSKEWAYVLPSPEARYDLFHIIPHIYLRIWYGCLPI